MSVLSIDFETRSTVDIKKTGVYPYASHESTDIWCLAWAFDAEEPAIWTPDLVEHDGDLHCGLPPRVLKHIIEGGEVRAWNAQFERLVWVELMVARYGAPEVPYTQWRCTAADAAAMSLPRSLGKAAAVLGVAEQKDDTGHRLMMRMARPRAFNADKSPIWWDVPEMRRQLEAYCLQDVRTEVAIARVTRRLPESELALYHFDQRINDRGVPLDRALVTGARSIVTAAVQAQDQALSLLTGGHVAKASQVGRLKEWLVSAGLPVTTLDKEAVRDLLADETLSAHLREVVTLRSESAKSSTAKLESMLAVAGPDDRLRGLMLYHGAGTGRWSGKLVQPHNFPRGTMKAAGLIPMVAAGDYDAVNAIAPPLEVVSNLLRAMLAPFPQWELIAADFSAIEARVLAWLAQDEPNLRAFAEKRDIYREMAGSIYAVAADSIPKSDTRRNLGKATELGAGYGMGPDKFRTEAKKQYGLILDEELAEHAIRTYRERHHAIKAYWKAANNAALAAVRTPGVAVPFGPLKNVRWVQKGAYLWLILPSGRALCYSSPKVEDRTPPWSTEEEPTTIPSVTVAGESSTTRQWQRYPLYGGLITENIVQAVARDLMAEAMLRVDKAGYPVILTVHDEIVSEVRRDFGSVEQYEALMSILPAWAAGCPVAAEGWRGPRFRK